MHLSSYQEKARTFAVYPNKGDNIIYPALGLAGEAGEFANQVKKVLRDDNGEITQDRRNALIDELGDVLWYVANEAAELGVDLDVIGYVNIRKLQERAKQDLIHGDKRNER